MECDIHNTVMLRDMYKVGVHYYCPKCLEGKAKDTERTTPSGQTKLVGSTDIFAKATEFERERCVEHIKRVLVNSAIEDNGHRLLCVQVALLELKQDGKIIP